LTGYLAAQIKHFPELNSQHHPSQF